MISNNIVDYYINNKKKNTKQNSSFLDILFFEIFRLIFLKNGNFHRKFPFFSLFVLRNGLNGNENHFQAFFVLSVYVLILTVTQE